jgi:hypothetical protein
MHCGGFNAGDIWGKDMVVEVEEMDRLLSVPKGVAIGGIGEPVP